MWRRYSRTNRLIATIILCLAMLGCIAAPARFAMPVHAASVPPFTLDVLEGYLWSSSEIFLAPGQAVVITNRDVARHTFTVEEWNIDVSLPSLIPVEVVVPDTAEPGAQVTFYSSIPGDQDGGLTGRITVVTEEEIIAGQSLNPSLGRSDPEPRVRIEARDDFTFQPAIATVWPGTLIEVVNTGVITHHFVVDEWDINQTISPGSMVLVRVPNDVRVGSSVGFYCSIPGHQQQGMVGVLRITGIAGNLGTKVQTTAGTPEAVIDMRSFLPGAVDLGQGWEKLRSGTSESVLGSRETHPDVFPYSGIGAVYVGPNGARVTIVVLPLRTDAIPVNQVSEAVREVQDSMAGMWTVDRIASAAWRSVAPPNGCTVSERVSGIVPVVTLPGGVTSCQLTGVGVALFVAVEGEYDSEVGVEASDLIVGRIVGGDYVERRVEE